MCSKRMGLRYMLGIAWCTFCLLWFLWGKGRLELTSGKIDSPELINKETWTESKMTLRNSLWLGRSTENTYSSIAAQQALSTLSLEIVVASCNSSLSWLFDDISAQLQKITTNPVSVNVISKCGNATEIAVHSDGIHVKVFTLPNKAGCDLAYAYFMRHYIEANTIENVKDVMLFFLKDSLRVPSNCHQKGHFRCLTEMLQIAHSRGFACGVEPPCSLSVFHDLHTLLQFSKESYIRHGDGRTSGEGFNQQRYKDFKDFISRECNNWRLPVSNVVEVCYGGSFALRASQLYKSPETIECIRKIEYLLAEGPDMSVVEHFAERFWAMLLSDGISEMEAEGLLFFRKDILRIPGKYMGTLSSGNADSC